MLVEPINAVDLVAEINALVRTLMGQTVNVRAVYGADGISVFIPHGTSTPVIVAAPKLFRVLPNYVLLTPEEVDAVCEGILAACRQSEIGVQKTFDLMPGMPKWQAQEIIDRLRIAGLYVNVWRESESRWGTYRQYRMTEEGSFRIFVFPTRQSSPKAEDLNSPVGGVAVGDKQKDAVVAASPPGGSTAAEPIAVPEKVEEEKMPAAPQVESKPDSKGMEEVCPKTSSSVGQSSRGGKVKRNGRGFSPDELEDRIAAGFPTLSLKEMEKLSSPVRLGHRFKPEKHKDYSR